MALIDKLTAIGNAIREKTGKANKLTLEQMPLEIAEIQTGVELNFKVVNGWQTEPSDPEENTIWVNTGVAITSWIFSATEPENPSEGMVWFSTGTTSPVEFNALKKNGIQIYPTAAKVYNAGAWQDKEAKIYQNGAWIDWFIYIHSVNGGYNKSYFGSYSIPFMGSTAFTVDQSGIYTVNGNASLSNFIIDNPIDLASYSFLEFETKGIASVSGFGVGFTSSNDVSTDTAMNPRGWGQFSWSAVSTSYTDWKKIQVDLTAANTKMYFRIGQWNSSGGFYVRNIILR